MQIGNEVGASRGPITIRVKMLIFARAEWELLPTRFDHEDYATVQMELVEIIKLRPDDKRDLQVQNRELR